MKITLVVLAVGGLMLAIQPGWSQAQQPAPNANETSPGTGGTSKAGVPGAPGNKSGPAAKPSTGTGPTGTGAGTVGGDESGVKGKPGGKSGPAVK